MPPVNPRIKNGGQRQKVAANPLTYRSHQVIGAASTVEYQSKHILFMFVKKLHVISPVMVSLVLYPCCIHKTRYLYYYFFSYFSSLRQDLATTAPNTLHTWLAFRLHYFGTAPVLGRLEFSNATGRTPSLTVMVSLRLPVAAAHTWQSFEDGLGIIGESGETWRWLFALISLMHSAASCADAWYVVRHRGWPTEIGEPAAQRGTFPRLCMNY